MASNRELRREASALGVALGVDVSTQGKNNAELAAIVDGLRARANALEKKLEDAVSKDDMRPAGGGAKPKTLESEAVKPDEAEEPRAPEPKPAPVTPAVRKASTHPYEVASGKDLMGTLKGTIRSGQEVRARYLPGGQAQLDEYVSKGIVLKR